MILAQDVGYKLPNSVSSSDLGQTFEQGRSHAKRMIFMSDHHPDLSNFRILTDGVVCYTDQPVGVECAKSISPMCRLNQLGNELVKINRVQREEPEVSIMVGEVLMECQSGLGVVSGEAA